MNRAKANGKCPMCGGKKKPGTTIYSVEIGSGVVVVRNVPASVCSQCGETWIDNTTARKLESIVQEAGNKGHQVEIMAF